MPGPLSKVAKPSDAPSRTTKLTTKGVTSSADGAAVKRRAAGRVEAVTDARGFFRLELEKIEALTLLCAGKLGYTNGIVTLEQDTAFSAIGPERNRDRIALATIKLRPIDRTDYAGYEWVSPAYLPRSKYDPAEHLNCGNCHRREFDAWKTSRHATMAFAGTLGPVVVSCP